MTLVTSSPRKLLEFKMQDRGKRTGRRVAKKERTKIRRGITNLFFSSTNERNRGGKNNTITIVQNVFYQGRYRSKTL